MGVVRLIANHQSSSPLEARQKSGSFPPPALPGLSGTMTLSDPRPGRRRLRRWRRNLPPLRVSPDYPAHPSGVPCPIPRRIATGARRLLPVPRGLPRFSAGSASAPSLSRPAQASLALRPVGLLNHPKAAFVARLPPRRVPPPKPLASYQIKPTTVWAEPSFTGDPRRRGALRNAG